MGKQLKSSLRKNWMTEALDAVFPEWGLRQSAWKNFRREMKCGNPLKVFKRICIGILNFSSLVKLVAETRLKDLLLVLRQVFRLLMPTRWGVHFQNCRWIRS